MNTAKISARVLALVLVTILFSGCMMTYYRRGHDYRPGNYGWHPVQPYRW